MDKVRELLLWTINHTCRFSYTFTHTSICIYQEAILKIKGKTLNYNQALPSLGSVKPWQITNVAINPTRTCTNIFQLNWPIFKYSLKATQKP